MSSLYSKVTWPELGRFKGRCMDIPLLRLKIEGGCSLQTCHIRTMTKLCLRVASDYLPVIDLGHPVTDLLFVAEHFDALGEHLHMECHGIGTSEVVVPVPIPALFVSVVRYQVSELFILHNNFIAIPPEFHLLRFGHLIVLKGSLELWILSDKLLIQSGLSELFSCVEHIICRICIEVALCALIQNVRIYDSTLYASAHRRRIPV